MSEICWAQCVHGWVLTDWYKFTKSKHLFAKKSSNTTLNLYQKMSVYSGEGCCQKWWIVRCLCHGNFIHIILQQGSMLGGSIKKLCHLVHMAISIIGNLKSVVFVPWKRLLDPWIHWPTVTPMKAQTSAAAKSVSRVRTHFSHTLMWRYFYCFSQLEEHSQFSPSFQYKTHFPDH